MDAQEYRRVTDLFQQACGLPASKRSAFLDQACAGSDQLRMSVEELLEQDSLAEGFLEPSTSAPPGIASSSVSTIRRVGQYDIVEEIGRGGMGVVLRAMQQTPRREVALKLINPDFLGARSAGRLEQEAELLGRLRHPGIAQIFEAGHAEVADDTETQPDRPFIAMELVDGLPLGSYTQAARPSIRQRVEILVKLCDAMQHAHQRGVVHLDLKPANILVDDSGAPRVLDFGVAKAVEPGIESRLAEKGSVVGTLVYMPPEQLTGHFHDLDTRADIFALGAVGYELLTGQMPRRVSESRLAESTVRGDDQRAVRNAMLSALVAPTPAAHNIDPAVDAELSAVLSRAMAPDREERYASIAQFGADLRRWLAYEPVEARRGGFTRRAKLFARRHRPVVIAGSVAVSTAASAVALLIYGTINAHTLAEREREATRAAELATADAEAEALRAGRMSEFLQNTIFGVDPEELGPDASFFDALEYASNRIHRDLADAPLVEAEVRYSLGFVYRRHSMFGPARRNIQAALRTWRERLGSDHPKAISAAEEIAYLALLVDGQAEQAATDFREILRLQAAAGRADSAEAGWQHLKLGRALLSWDRLSQADMAFETSGDLLAKHYGEAFRARAMTWQALAALAADDRSRAEELAREALERVAGASEQGYAEGHVRLVLARTLVEAGKFEEARNQLDSGIMILSARLPEDHIDIADAYEVAARHALAIGDRRAAAAHAGTCHSIRSSRLGPDHPDLVIAKALHIMTSIAAERPADALHQLDEAFQTAEQLVGPDHRLCLELLTMSIQVAESSGDDLAAQNKRHVLESLSERRGERLSMPVATTHR